MKTTLGIILITIPFLFFLLVYMEGGMFGVLMYVMYLFAASCSMFSFIVGMLLIRNRKFK